MITGVIGAFIAGFVFRLIVYSTTVGVIGSIIVAFMEPTHVDAVQRRAEAIRSA